VRVLDLFSGIGGFRLGLEHAGGYTCVGSCEQAAFPRRVWAERFSEGVTWSDVRDVRANDVLARGGVDLVTAGFPCQDTSIAGRQAGLDGERSGLVWEALRIAADVRASWILLENSPRLLSLHGGADYGRLLARLDDLGHGWAWRVLDAQFFGLAQRRRRLFILAGRAGAEACGQVLLEPESCPGDPPTRGGARDDAVGAAAPGTGADGVSRPLLAHGRRYDLETKTFVLGAFGAKACSGSNPGTGWTEEVAPPCRVAQETAIVLQVNSRAEPRLTEVAGCLVAQEGGFKQGQWIAHETSERYVVRRLTPLESERLQGFPDGWTALPGAKDSPRNRALGNAVPPPVVEWIGRRLATGAVAH
jgi:DNA (cytosine-5)-methyltransferase 1